MTQPTYVVAFNYKDFKNWCRDHEVYFGDSTKVRHITEVGHVHGCRFEPGQVQYTERSAEHRDAAEIRYWITDRTMETMDQRAERLRLEFKSRVGCGVDHDSECCYVHKVHSDPHQGCILR